MPDLYAMNMSAPCRSVMLTAKAVGVELNVKNIDLFKGETKTPEFIAINPQHCVPTLVDGDLKLWESRAICSYLASKYGKDDTLYPNNPNTRAMVDQRLYFDMGTLYQRFGDYVFPVILGGKEKPTEGTLDKLHEALVFLEGFLEGHNWVAGDNMTVADHTLIATVAQIKEAGVDLSKYSNITAWMKRSKEEMPGYEECNVVGAKKFGVFAKSKLSF